MPDACLVPPYVHDGGLREVPVSKPFTAFLSINGAPIITPTRTEAHLRLSCYDHGISIDPNRLAHLTVFVKDVVKASANQHPNSATSLAEYCAEAKIFGSKPAVLSVKTQATFLRIAQGTSHMLIHTLHGERPLS